MRKIVAAVSLAFVPAITSACEISPEFGNLEAFLKAKGDDQVIFLGTVKSIHALPQESVTKEWDITFEADKWWRGTPQDRIAVLGGSRTRARTSCEGVDDFSARENEQWLIVGTSYKGKILPVRWLSIKLANGSLPPEIEEQLTALTKPWLVR